MEPLEGRRMLAGQSPTVDLLKIENINASASFRTSDAGRNRVTTVTVTAGVDIIRENGSTVEQPFCALAITSMGEENSTPWFGLGSMTNPTLTISKNMSLSRVRATVPVDFIYGLDGGFVDVQVDVTWTATGKPVIETFNDGFFDGNTRIVSTSRAETTSVRAVGKIVVSDFIDGNPANLATAPSIYGLAIHSQANVLTLTFPGAAKPASSVFATSRVADLFDEIPQN
jgi:hypothetical protein